ncbi:MAG: hypothetical protein AB2697_07660 [Candidatus Thiodiazotropha endolucinida]
MSRITPALFFTLIIPSAAFADAFTPGNLMLSTDNTIYETTPQGQIMQSFPTQYPGGSYPATEYARDLAVDATGVVHLYNGTFSPYMSSYAPAAEPPSWTHQTYPSWNTANNGSYGGIDVEENQVFVTDGLADSGVVTFNTDSGTAFRFADGTESIDLTIGLDGLLYVLSPGGSPGGRTIDVYDPNTYGFVRLVDLTSIFGWTEHRSIAIDVNGDLFIADWDGEIHKVNANGDLLQTISPACDWIGRETPCSFTDIDISETGQLALGSRFGEVIVTDVNFSSVSKFQIGDRGIFVEFVPQPAGPTEVEINIRPNRDPNKINLERRKNLWVAILSNDEFDAASVDQSTVRLGPAGAGINQNPKLVDTDGDGDHDLKLSFKVSEIGISCGDTELGLTGTTIDGMEIIGTDSIVTTGCD